MFSLRFTIFLLLVLFIPLSLRTLKQIEPYPAVLLPSGVSLIKKVNNQVKLKVKKLYAIDKTGNWKKVDLRLLLHPIPLQFSEGLASKDFGFDTDFLKRNGGKDSLLNKTKNLNTVSANKEELKDLRKWLKTKLVEQNFATSTIKSVSYLETISIETGVVLEQEVIYERIIELD